MDEEDFDLGWEFMYHYFVTLSKINKTSKDKQRVSYPDKVTLPTQEFIQFYFNNKKFKNDSFDNKVFRAIKDLCLYGFKEYDKISNNEADQLTYDKTYPADKFYAISNILKKNY